MPSDAPGLSIIFVHCYQFGIRLKQAQTLHGNFTGMSRWANKAFQAHVRSALFRLTNAAEDLVGVVNLSHFKDRVHRAVNIIDEGWDRFVRTEGYGEDPLTVQQGLKELEYVARGLAGQLGERAELARVWIEVGKLIVQTDTAVASRVAREGQKRLEGLLKQVKVELPHLVTTHGGDDEPSLLGLPEDYLIWHQVEIGLQKLLQSAAPDTLQKIPQESQTSLSEQRNKWIYEQSLNPNISWDNIKINIPVKNLAWDEIDSKQGVQQAAVRYAEKHGLPLPPPRKRKRSTDSAT